jgi:DNA-binding NarL/FixJ family response regulator
LLSDYEKSLSANHVVIHGAKRPCPLRILIADESRQFRKFIRRRFDSEAGFEVVGEVLSGSDLLPLSKQLRPDVVLVDIALSGMAGLEEARRIKSEMPSTAVVFLSLVEEDALREAATRYGADDFLTKDVLISELFSRVRRCAAKSMPEGY